MKVQRTILLQQFQAQQDVDYVERFQALAALNLDIKRAGATSERLLCKASLEMDIGNHAAALTAARHAIQLAPRDSEPHYVAARALVLLAMVRAHAIAGAPGAADEEGEGPVQLVQDASRELRALLRLNPSDEEALEGVAILDALLVTNPSDSQLEKALAGQVVP